MRFKALEILEARKSVPVNVPSENVSEYFATNVFNDRSMRTFLGKEAYNAVKEAVEQGKTIDRDVADHIAAGMKRWAISKGASHYTHWFQPLTGSTAEKHDSFYEPEDGMAIEKFSGSSLVQQEPDASSLPSGGLRNTFEARGYTAWDPGSPAFIYENTSGKTLCIPTIFVSYNGEALDYKAPLLKSLNLVDKAATDVCRFFDPQVNKVAASLGIEQEYFLIDRAMYHARPDLVMSDRTLFGHAPAKGQQMEDHYFGSIPDRVFNFMYELEVEALKLGIPLKTRHNEVAPGQYECAPMFEEVNLAIDHNQLLMDLMEEVAHRHNFEVILHEKPFAGINGSGKHNNWSLITNTGINLLAPGKEPNENLQFLTFFINTIKAFHESADIIRASIASASNDHRLGANEAPPAIMSIFIGSTLTKVLEAFSKNEKASSTDEDKTINIFRVPEILVDNTDRNRTSPFAFTGNKFELRAVGSSSNSANAMTALNTAMASQLIEFKAKVDALIANGTETSDALIQVLKKELADAQARLFEGNGYSDEWVVEAEKRGLSNIKTTPEALDAVVSNQAEKIFVQNGIFTLPELKARHEIFLEEYIKKLQIEGRLISDLTYTHILPAAIEYQTVVAGNINELRAAGLDEDIIQPQVDLLRDLSKHIGEMKKLSDQMLQARKDANMLQNTKERAMAYCTGVKELFDQIRYHADKLEIMVDDQLWRLPKYREMLFIR